VAGNPSAVVRTGPRLPTSSAASAAGPAARRYVTDGRYGRIVVDVVGDAVFVNGDPVEPAAAVQPCAA
jgi:hypothetical protein